MQTRQIAQKLSLFLKDPKRLKGRERTWAHQVWAQLCAVHSPGAMLLPKTWDEDQRQAKLIDILERSGDLDIPDAWQIQLKATTEPCFAATYRVNPIQTGYGCPQIREVCLRFFSFPSESQRHAFIVAKVSSNELRTPLAIPVKRSPTWLDWERWRCHIQGLPFVFPYEENDTYQTEKAQVDPPKALGAALFETCFQQMIGTAFTRQLGWLEGHTQHLLRLVLEFDPNDPPQSWLANLPWECLQKEGDPLFKSRVNIVRRLVTPDTKFPLFYLQPPGRWQALICDPKQDDQLNLNEELQCIQATLQHYGITANEACQPSDLHALKQTLRNHPHQLLHICGHADNQNHGSYGLPLGQTVAAPHQIADALSEPLPQCIFLNVCRKPAIGHHTPDGEAKDLAEALIKRGSQATLVFQQHIGNRYAIQFAKTFYRELAHHKVIDIALIQGRQAIDPHHNLPQLYLQNPNFLTPFPHH